MYATATITTADSSPSLSLVDTIANLHSEFCHMKNELRDALRNNARLQNELAGQQRRAAGASMPEADLASLRRDLAFYCHPDRGGDAVLMRRMNTLFDFLLRSQELHLENGTKESA